MVFVCLFISACSQQETPTTGHQQQAVSVIDATGNAIRLDKPARRIIALAPHVVENVYSAGAGDQLVGVVDFSDFPEQANKLPIVGGYRNVNLEKIIELKPDLIIAWQSGNSHNSYDRLKELGFTVYIDQPDTLRDVAKSIKDIGILSGHPDTAKSTADAYLTQLDVIEKRYQSASKVNVFYQVWNKPLRTISGNHIITDAMEICGGINIYADEFAVAPVINIESIIERNPVAIFASGMSDARPEWLDDWKQWPSLKAVQKDNLFFVDPDHIQRHTLRLLLGVDAICTQLDLARKKSQANE